MYMERKSTLRIRSVSDVITNSSDEVYAVKTQLTPEEVEKKWNEFLESCSGKPGCNPANHRSRKCCSQSLCRSGHT